MFRELDFFVAILSLGKQCEDHGIITIGPVVRKPHLIKNGRKIDCNTANYLPFIFPGLSTSSSRSSLRTSPTSSSQEAVLHSIPHQQEMRVQVALREYGRDPLREPEEKSRPQSK